MVCPNRLYGKDTAKAKRAENKAIESSFLFFIKVLFKVLIETLNKITVGWFFGVGTKKIFSGDTLP